MNFPFNPFDSRTELERHQRSKAFVHLWSSLSDETHGELVRELQDIGIADQVTSYKDGDVPSGRSVHRASDHAVNAGRRNISDLSALLSTQAEVLTVTTPDGTGMIGVEALRPYSREPLDAVTRLLTVSPNPTGRERICRAFNLATLNRDNVQNVFISKQSHDETPRYPRALAKIETSILFLDSLNLFEPAIAHDTIPARDVATTRRTIEKTIRDLRTDLGHTPSGLLGFNPDDWLAPGATIQQDQLWSENPYRAYLVVPQQYEESRLTENLVNGDDNTRITSCLAPVSDVRVLLTREVSDVFIQKAKTSGVTWLYENAHDIDAWVKEVNSECSTQTDPQQEVCDFLTEELNVYDPEILTALREVGADV